jgi:hypothetical protein
MFYVDSIYPDINKSKNIHISRQNLLHREESPKDIEKSPLLLPKFVEKYAYIATHQRCLSRGLLSLARDIRHPRSIIREMLLL